MSFENRVVLITGSNSGIGQNVALYFATQKAKLTIHGQSQEKLEQTLDMLKNSNVQMANVHHVKGSLDEDRVIEALINETINKFGKLDVLINNAAVYEKPNETDPNSIETFDYVMRVNLRAPIQLIKLAKNHLIQQKGCVINVSSVLAKVPNFAAHYYSVTKSALEHYTKAVALDLAPYGVRSNCVSLGCIDTSFLASERSSAPSHLMELYKEALIWRTPQKRMGNVRDATEAIAFLASDKANFVTGSILDVDGGFSCGLVPTNEFVAAVQKLQISQ